MRNPVDRLEACGLTENWAFLRRVARGLVLDDHLAEDLAQDAALEVLRGGGAPHSSMRGWLVGILRNLSRRHWRAKSRRVVRERAVRPPASAITPPEAAVHTELRWRVARAVQEIEEPYRTVLILRFVDGLGPTAISERLAVPVRTVETRLRRGLSMLRARLDREYGGDRRAWCAPLLLLLDPRSARSLPGRSIGIGGIAVGAAALLLFFLLRGAAPGAPGRFPILPTDADPAEAAASVHTAGPRLARITASAGASSGEHAPSDREGGGHSTSSPSLETPDGFFETLSGEVIDGTTREPVPLARVGYGTGAGFWWRTRTDEEGRFRLRVRRPEEDAGRLPFRLRVQAREYGEWEACPDRPEMSIELFRLAAPPDTGSIVGVALDGDGRPMEGILSITARRGDEGRFRLSAVADRNGEFRLDGLEPGTWYFALGWRDPELDVFVAEHVEAAVTLCSASPREDPRGKRAPPRVQVLMTGLEDHDGVVLQAFGANERWRTVIREGAARFPSLPVGSHQFMLLQSGAGCRTAIFVLGEDDAIQTLRFPTAPGENR